jgi:hypothetical protein
LSINGETYNDPSRVASHFNNFITNIASNLVQKLSAAKNLNSVASDTIKNFYRNKSQKEFHLHQVSEEFVYKELYRLNINKSTGLDGIPAKFLKDGADVLKFPISYIVNSSITEGVVPDNIKIAEVKPLHKKNSKLDVGNYRSVSILCIVFKILERAVYIQFESFL